MSFKLQKNDQLVTPVLAGGYKVESWTMQDATGATYPVPMQTVQVKSSDTDYSILAEEVLYTETITPDDPNVVNLSVSSHYNNLNMRTIFDASGSTATGDTVFTLTLGEGFSAYSETAGVPALTTGTWPAGATVNLIVNGLVAGRGGNAGGGGFALYTGGTPDYSLIDGGDGADGTVAIDCQHDLTILINTTGVIGGGGGGGGGGGSAQDQAGL